MFMHKKLKKIIWICLGSLGIILSVFGYTYIVHRPSGALEVYIFALNKGSSSLIITPEGKRILVNGGPNNEIVRHISRILPFYSRTIDALIVTDEANKEIFGLIDIIQRYHIRELYIPSFLAHPENSNLTLLLDPAKSRNVEVHELKARDTVSFGSSTDVQVLFPQSPSMFAYSTSSPPSLVFILSGETGRVLFAGNASKKIQNSIVKDVPELRSDILYVMNSAGASLLSDKFVTATQPELVIFDKKPTVRATSSKTTSKTKNPLEEYTADKLYNIRENGSVRILFLGLGKFRLEKNI
jgi:beta-lactamase superfamily II metal-dependent hydrolase